MDLSFTGAGAASPTSPFASAAVGTIEWLMHNCVKVSSENASILPGETWFLLQKDSPFWTSLTHGADFQSLFDILNRLQAGILGTNYLYNSMLISHWITIVVANDAIAGFIFMNYEFRFNFPLAEWPGYGTIKRSSSRASKSPRATPDEPKSFYFHVSAVCRSTFADSCIGIGKRLMDFQKVIVREMAKSNPDYKNLIVIDAVVPLDTSVYPTWGFSKIASRADGVAPMAMIVDYSASTSGIDLICATDINTDVTAVSYDEINSLPNYSHLSALQSLHDASVCAIRLPKAKTDAKYMPGIISALMNDVQTPEYSSSGYEPKEINRLLKYRKHAIGGLTFQKPKPKVKYSVAFLEGLRSSI